jgi:hypothetical protein
MFVRTDNLQKGEFEIMQRALIAGRKFIQIGIDEMKYEAAVHKC